MRVDPAIVQIHAENVRAEILARPPESKLDAAMIRKIGQKVPLFREMPVECLTRTLALAEQFSVAEGEVVFREGDIGDSFFILIAGEVVVEKVRNARVVELARLGVGDSFGEMALVGKHLRSATVRARRDTVAMRFYRERVDANVEGAHIIYRNIASILAARLEESSATMADLVVQNTRP